MRLADQVNVAPRFQRAIRIDTDLGDPAALDGFVCPQSFARVFENMAQHTDNSGQGAFTWVGPYGCGKSSLAVVVGSILNGNNNLRSKARAIVGEQVSNRFLEVFPVKKRGWRVLPVVGRRDRLSQVIGEAIDEHGLLNKADLPFEWNEKEVLRVLKVIADQHPRSGGGLVVFIDEFGKCLESAARDGTDIHLFQQLAEIASRSGGRLLIIGILHQAFEEYAHRLSRNARDEWAKIQGRYVDLPINVDRNEQISLLARAIDSDHEGNKKVRVLAKGVASLVQNGTRGRKHDFDLATTLAKCWPLHPVTAYLLGPLSRRRFGQNQRSLFGFLNSAEPNGFRDFLNLASDFDLYTADRLWDYLQVNLEPSILVSPDGHRWAQASEAIKRCETSGGTEEHVRLLKVIALTDLLKERSRLSANGKLLDLALPADESISNGEILNDLKRWSLVTFRKHVGAWTIFEGSDFDIDKAVELADQEMTKEVGPIMERLASFRAMVAKEHYHKTGALRWFDVKLVSLASLEETVRSYEPHHGAIGCFILAVSTEAESPTAAEAYCREVVKHDGKWEIVIGLSTDSQGIPDLAIELEALEYVSQNHPELQGDRVARLEVEARIEENRVQLERYLEEAFDKAIWFRKKGKKSDHSRTKLNRLASRIADERFWNAPILHNELVGRTRPSCGAIAARNALMYRMVFNESEERLGIEGFPAEGGLYYSILEATKLHQETEEGWQFISPDSGGEDPCKLASLWRAGRELLKEKSKSAVPVAELHEIWRNAPFGVKEGLLPLLSLAFLLSESGNLAIYRQGIFQVGFTDLDVDFLKSDPTEIQVCWLELTGINQNLLVKLAAVVRELAPDNELRCLEPIDVARGLVAIFDRLPSWVRRTQRLSRNAIRVRQLLKQANDPNKLIFDDLQKFSLNNSNLPEKQHGTSMASTFREGLLELHQAYPGMLNRLREQLLTELQVPFVAPAMMKELRARAANVRELGGDHRMEAFIVRIACFEGSDADIENLGGLAVNKPVHTWTDIDIDKATVELAAMAQRFVRAETFAHVKGRKNNRHAMAVVVGLAGRPVTMQREFVVANGDRRSVESMADAIDSVLNKNGKERR